MASPIKTWTSVLIVIVICWALAYNATQIIGMTKGLANDDTGLLKTAHDGIETDLEGGLPGSGTVCLLFGIACLAVAFNKHEKPHMSSSQKSCLIVVGILLFVQFLTHLIPFIEQKVMTDPTAIVVTILSLSGFRVLLSAAVVGCGAYLMHNN